MIIRNKNQQKERKATQSEKVSKETCGIHSRTANERYRKYVEYYKMQNRRYRKAMIEGNKNYDKEHYKKYSEYYKKYRLLRKAKKAEELKGKSIG